MKRLLTAVAFIGLSGVSLTAAVETVFTQPQGRAARDQAALRDWLLTADLTQVSASELRDTVRQASSAFRQGFSWNAASEGLSAAERERMVRNFQQITRVWLLDHVAAWQEAPQKKRTSYVDRETRALLEWKLPASGKLRPTEDFSGDPRGKLYDQSARLDRLEADVRTWLDREPAELQRQVREYLGIIRGNVIARDWMRWLPGR